MLCWLRADKMFLHRLHNFVTSQRRERERVAAVSRREWVAAVSRRERVADSLVGASGSPGLLVGERVLDVDRAGIDLGLDLAGRGDHVLGLAVGDLTGEQLQAAVRRDRELLRRDDA